MASRTREGPNQGLPPTERPKALRLDERNMTESIMPAVPERDSHSRELMPAKRSGMFEKGDEGAGGSFPLLPAAEEGLLEDAYFGRRSLPRPGAVPDLDEGSGGAFPEEENPTRPYFDIPAGPDSLMEPDDEEKTVQMSRFDLPSEVFQPPDDLASDPAESGGVLQDASLDSCLRALSEDCRKGPGAGLSHILDAKSGRSPPATAEEHLGMLRDHLLMVVERRVDEAFRRMPSQQEAPDPPAVVSLVLATAYLRKASHQVIEEVDADGQNGCVRIEGQDGLSFMLFINPNRNPKFEGLGSKKGHLKPGMGGMSLKSMAIINCGDALFCLFPVEKA